MTFNTRHHLVPRLRMGCAVTGKNSPFMKIFSTVMLKFVCLCYYCLYASSTEDKRNNVKNSFYSHYEKLGQACMNSVVPYENS